MTDLEQKLINLGLEPKKNEPLSKYTSWKIGGPAELLVEVSDSSKLAEVLSLIPDYNIPVTVLGGGSNVLISDRGISGVVIINRSRNIHIHEHLELDKNINQSEQDEFDIWVAPRHGEEGDERFYTFQDLDYQETGTQSLVTLDSGVQMPYAIAWTLKNGLTGLQWFGGIPGTVGGALYNNIHGGTKHFSDYFFSATVLENGFKKTVSRDFFNFAYDQSVLRENKNVFVLDVTLKLFHDDTQKAHEVAKEWTSRKRLQPKITAGCIFQNIKPETQQALGFPTPSIGYILDKKLGLAGTQKGEAQISLKHAAFIENLGNATAEDVLFLIKLIKKSVYDHYKVKLEPEINLLGFSPNELEGVY